MLSSPRCPRPMGNSSLGRLSSCSNPLVVDMVREQLAISAQGVVVDDDLPFPTLPLLEHRAPSPGEVAPGTAE